MLFGPGFAVPSNKVNPSSNSADREVIVLVASLMGAITFLIVIFMCIKLALICRQREKYDFATVTRLKKYLPAFLPLNEFKVSLSEADAISDDLSEVTNYNSNLFLFYLSALCLSFLF